MSEVNMKAFPTRNAEEGMDLRDYFAAKAMQAYLADKDLYECCEEAGDIDFHDLVADMAYQIADSMMKERKNESS
jgi:hypothetical protein